jgi:hypothetical protein
MVCKTAAEVGSIPWLGLVGYEDASSLSAMDERSKRDGKSLLGTDKPRLANMFVLFLAL